MVSQTYTLPAPIGGLNGINALAQMPESDAIVLDNFFPQPGWVELRNGYAQWSTGYTGWVETLLPYSGTSEKLFAINNGKVYDATSSGSIGAALVTGLSNSRFEYANMATAGGEYLYAANAADDPLLYDGSSWAQITGISSPIAITGVTTTTLRSPAVWKNRVWFIQDGTLVAWYLPTGAVGGAASSFDFTAIFDKGGTLAQIVTLSLVDGSSFDNYIGFLTTEGQIALYQGTDPAQAGMFVLVGVYEVGVPIGRRCKVKYGSDTLILTSYGLVSFMRLISDGLVNTKDAVTYKIQYLVNQDVQTYSGNWGWEACLYPLGNKLILNVPQATESAISQYVMNTISNAWCTFGRYASSWLAATFCVLGNTLYFGGNGYVAQADIGQADNGNNINGLLKTAFTYCKADRQKKINMIRPTIQANGNVMINLGVNVDYTDVPPSSLSTVPAPPGSVWNTASWNVSPWATGYNINNHWQSAGGVGFAFSTYLSVASNAIQLRLQAIDYLYEPGGVL